MRTQFTFKLWRNDPAKCEGLWSFQGSVCPREEPTKTWWSNQPRVRKPTWTLWLLRITTQCKVRQRALFDPSKFLKPSHSLPLRIRANKRKRSRCPKEKHTNSQGSLRNFGMKCQNLSIFTKVMSCKQECVFVAFNVRQIAVLHLWCKHDIYELSSDHAVNSSFCTQTKNKAPTQYYYYNNNQDTYNIQYTHWLITTTATKLTIFREIRPNAILHGSLQKKSPPSSWARCWETDYSRDFTPTPSLQQSI